MAAAHLDLATKKLQENIGNFVTVFHKWQRDPLSESFLIDECIVKILSVTPPSLLVRTPYIEVEFANGKKAKLEYSAEFQGQLLLFWDYQKIGRLFNNFFVKKEEDKWVYTFPDIDKGEAMRDPYLRTGIHHIKFYSSRAAEKNAIIAYLEHLQEANVNREIRRAEVLNQRAVLTIEPKKEEEVSSKELDRLFHTA